MSDQNEDFSAYSPLARLLARVARPGLFWVLVAACILVLLLGYTFTWHGEFEMENINGFYAVFGFVAFVTLVILSALLRLIVSRPEEYYGDKSVNAEDYPKDQLGKDQLGRSDHDV